MDEEDVRRVLAAKRQLDAAERAAEELTEGPRNTFHAIVHDLYYGPKRHGDGKRLAELLGVSTSQVKRYADGETSGNKPPRRSRS